MPSWAYSRTNSLAKCQKSNIISLNCSFFSVITGLIWSKLLQPWLKIFVLLKYELSCAPEAPTDWLGPHRATHRGHLTRDEVAILCQHVRHHECGQLGVGIRVDEAVVRQRVAEVAGRVVLHQVKKRRLGVVGWSDGGDLIVLIPGSVSTACAATAASSPASTTSLTCVALRASHREEKSEGTKVGGSNGCWILDQTEAKRHTWLKHNTIPYGLQM